MLELRRAAPEDLGAIENLLSICLLPHSDIRHETATFFVAETERGIIGVAGIEDCGERCGLIRSVGVMPGYRKQHVARQLLQRVVAHAAERDLRQLYLLTGSASDYFGQLGFVVAERNRAPAGVKASRLFRELCTGSATLMHRALPGRLAQSGPDAPMFSEVAANAGRHFDAGYHCAESVLLAVADRLGIRSPLIPAIATGFCHGVSGTWGTCGALNGAIMAVSLAYGRKSPGQSTDENYRIVRRLLNDFTAECGSTQCSELLACDLDTSEGRKVYESNRLRSECREYIGTAARLAACLVNEKVSLSEERAA